MALSATKKKNLDLIHSKKQGGMAMQEFQESISGNAGTFKGMPCDAYNFFYDSETGEIKYFGNWQNVPAEIRSHYSQGTFRRASDYRHHKVGIVEIQFSSGISRTAKTALTKTAEEYNQEKGWKEKIEIPEPRKKAKSEEAQLSSFTEEGLRKFFAGLKKRQPVAGTIFIIAGIILLMSQFLSGITGLATIEIINQSSNYSIVKIIGFITLIVGVYLIFRNRQ